MPFFFTTYGKAIRARKKVAEAVRAMVRESGKESGGGENNKKKKDMLGALSGDGSEGGFCDEEIVDFLLALLVAGYDTTSTIITLAVKFLTETPLCFGSAQGKKPSKARLLTWVHVDRLHYGVTVTANSINGTHVPDHLQHVHFFAYPMEAQIMGLGP